MTNPDHIEMGVLRVLTLDDPEDVSHHGRVIERHFPGVDTTSRCIPDHPDGIPDVESEADAVPYVEELGREMAADVDVLGVSCALDPAVDSLDADLDVPVVGAGASVAAAALARGDRVGTLGLESGTPPNVADLLGDRLAASETVVGADTTNFLTTDGGRKAIRASVERLADAGCDVVAPSCTGLTTSGVLADLGDSLEIPVVDPVVAMAAVGTTALLPTESVAE
ncbi:aspartate/glutamate racemase family protein [Halorussus halobius]|uniref:aspartate/glutamate racemase family protein n=1 Tax=Halorussus halobius TaxID=1710537 RepID=UPI0010918888|nr:aspartate/glutamate racemase family protein [Halorussus halobius]